MPAPRFIRHRWAEDQALAEHQRQAHQRVIDLIERSEAERARLLEEEQRAKAAREYIATIHIRSTRKIVGSPVTEKWLTEFRRKQKLRRQKEQAKQRRLERNHPFLAAPPLKQRIQPPRKCRHRGSYRI